MDREGRSQGSSLKIQKDVGQMHRRHGEKFQLSHDLTQLYGLSSEHKFSPLRMSKQGVKLDVRLARSDGVGAVTYSL